MAEDFTDEFTGADLNDLRRSRRLARVALALSKSPAPGISAAGCGWGETMAVYRLLICWLRLASKEVATLEQVRRILDLYMRRCGL